MLSPLSAAAASHAQDALHPRYAQRLRREQAAQDLAHSRRANYFDTAIQAFSEMDSGGYRKGILGGWGIDKRDATADRRLIEFCLSLPLDMLLSGGARRPLAKAALSDRLPAEVLSETRKGYQGADWGLALSAGRPEAERLVEQMAADPVASDIIDIAHLRTLLEEWPTGDWANRRLIARYRSAFLLALTAGQFILNAKLPELAKTGNS
jgi:asparagine synthase (glutamine-hydrolysing)